MLHLRIKRTLYLAGAALVPLALAGTVSTAVTAYVASRGSGTGPDTVTVFNTVGLAQLPGTCGWDVRPYQPSGG